MNAKICDSCNKTIPEDSTYFVYEAAEYVVGNGVAKNYKYFDLCPYCQNKIFNYILKDVDFNREENNDDN